ncbi:unnamed protein product [Heligmosomoides polygyrus]|uniref:Secreted protein n=1 Tax=Heligmosomoides polygyrus TaxID=6339 RepID=A0A183FKI0_HELPZ|nr:unnamed protein product [Heligmosomoides polygyrus]
MFLAVFVEFSAGSLDFVPTAESLDLEPCPEWSVDSADSVRMESARERLANCDEADVADPAFAWPLGSADGIVVDVGAGPDDLVADGLPVSAVVAFDAEPFPLFDDSSLFSPLSIFGVPFPSSSFILRRMYLN